MTLVQEAAVRHEKELADERQRQKAVLDEQRSATLNLQDRKQKREASLVQAKKEVHADCGSVYRRIRGCRGGEGAVRYMEYLEHGTPVHEPFRVCGRKRLGE